VWKQLNITFPKLYWLSCFSSLEILFFLNFTFWDVSSCHFFTQAEIFHLKIIIEISHERLRLPPSPSLWWVWKYILRQNEVVLEHGTLKGWSWKAVFKIYEVSSFGTLTNFIIIYLIFQNLRKYPRGTYFQRNRHILGLNRLGTITIKAPLCCDASPNFLRLVVSTKLPARLMGRWCVNVAFTSSAPWSLLPAIHSA
jgi:hypothetical protein